MFWLLRNFSGSRKAGFVAAVSDFALIVLKAMDGSFAQCGMRPHFIPESCRLFRVLGQAAWERYCTEDSNHPANRQRRLSDIYIVQRLISTLQSCAGLTILTAADLAFNSLHFGKQNAKETVYASNSASAVDTRKVHSIR